MSKQIEKILEFVEIKGLIPELREYLKPKAEELKPDRFADIKALIGATSSKRNDAELREKFVTFMLATKGATDEKKGVHLDAILTAQRDVLPTDANFKTEKNNTRNWLDKRTTSTGKNPASVGKVEGKDSTYYYIAPEGTTPAKKSARAALATA